MFGHVVFRPTYWLMLCDVPDRVAQAVADDKFEWRMLRGSHHSGRIIFVLLKERFRHD